MQVSVIIVNYNTRELLCQCLSSIREKTKDVEYEVIVVDNASKDDSKDVVTHKFPWVKWIQSPENLGFGKANNLGITYSSGKYLFFLNSDTILVNNAIGEFYSYSEKSSNEFGALGAILLDADHKNCHSYGNFITPTSELRTIIAKYLRFLKPKGLLNPVSVRNPKEVDYITGADLWVPHKIYEELGGFDPNFFMYCEETDWQKRMADAGYPRLIIPGPQIIHLEGGSDPSASRIWSPNRLKNFYTSKKYYHRKHFSKWGYPFFKFTYVVLKMPLIMLLIYLSFASSTCG